MAALSDNGLKYFPHYRFMPQLGFEQGNGGRQQAVNGNPLDHRYSSSIAIIGVILMISDVTMA